MKPIITNRKGRFILRTLIYGITKGKQAKADNDAKKVGKIAKSAAPLLEHLIPYLPDEQMKIDSKHALRMLERVNKEFEEGKGSFKSLSPVIAFLTNAIRKNMANHS